MSDHYTLTLILPNHDGNDYIAHVCSLCGAVVVSDKADAHTRWHRSLPRRELVTLR